MRLLDENPDLTQRELAQSLGVSVGSVNYCLKALVDKGSVKMKNFAYSKNKFGYIYVLTPSGLAEKALITKHFLQHKIDEYEKLKAEIEVLKSEIQSDHEEIQKVWLKLLLSFCAEALEQGSGPYREQDFQNSSYV